MPGLKDLRRLVRASVLAVAVAAALAPAANAASPPPPPLSALFEDTNPTVTGSCDLGGTSTIKFTASGIAVGTYPGPYTEKGTITLGPQPFIGQQVDLQTFTATFTINSPVGLVTGTKELETDPPSSGGLCYEFQFGDIFLDTRVASGLLRWEAVIQTPDGRRFRDRGEAAFNLADVDSPPADEFHFFNEGLASELETLEPIQPGKGCGDKNHEHEREGECKKTPR